MTLTNATFQVVAYNAGSSVPGKWTREVYPMPETNTESFGSLFIIIIVVIVALVLLIVIVIFVCRNPKDTCVSFYHHHALFPDYKMKPNFPDFANLFLQGALEYGSYWTMLKVKSRYSRSLIY